MPPRQQRQRRRQQRKQRKQRGGRAVDVQKWISKLGVAFQRGDPGKNRLDRIAKQQDIDYSKARNIRDKWKADEKMVKAIDRLPGRKTGMERVARGIIKTKTRLNL